MVILGLLNFNILILCYYFKANFGFQESFEQQINVPVSLSTQLEDGVNLIFKAFKEDILFQFFET